MSLDGLKKLVHVGFGKVVDLNEVVAMASRSPSGFWPAPIGRLIRQGKENKRVVDLARGTEAKGALFTDSNKIILISFYPETIDKRAGDPDWLNNRRNLRRENGFQLPVGCTALTVLNTADQ